MMQTYAPCISIDNHQIESTIYPLPAIVISNQLQSPLAGRQAISADNLIYESLDIPSAPFHDAALTNSMQSQSESSLAVEHAVPLNNPFFGIELDNGECLFHKIYANYLGTSA